MKFVPFQEPDSDYNGLNTGLSTEGGVTAKGFVSGVNKYLAHLFGAITGEVQTGDAPDSATRIKDLEEAVAALQIKVDALIGPTALELGAAVRAAEAPSLVIGGAAATIEKAAEPDEPPVEASKTAEPPPMVMGGAQATGEAAGEAKPEAPAADVSAASN